MPRNEDSEPPIRPPPLDDPVFVNAAFFLLLEPGEPRSLAFHPSDI
jgi:hypothetical protein